MTQENWLQAQYSVLGSALIEPTVVPKVIQQTRIADFSGQCQTVYAAMRKLFQDGTPVDVVSLAAALGDDYRKFLMELMQVTPTAANLDHYIKLCREQAMLLSVKDLARQVAAADSAERIRGLLDQANSMMVDKPSLRITTMGDALQSFMERHSGEVKYLTWPVRELNDRLYAEAGDFILIGGRPSTGKTAWTLQCAEHWAHSMRVGFFSLETSPEKLFDRQMASKAGLDMGDIKRNSISESQWERIMKMHPEIVKLPLEIIPAAGMTPADIRSVTMMRRYHLIIIDYVQLIQSGGNNRTEQVTNISLALHRMAQDMQVTVVALSQLKRKTDDSAPDSSDLRESGQLEQDADIIMQLQLEKKDQPEGNRFLYITKNKEGTTPRILLAFDGKHQRFSKAANTGSVVSSFVADGKRARRKIASDASDAAKSAEAAQMTMLPDKTAVPWEGQDERTAELPRC